MPESVEISPATVAAAGDWTRFIGSMGAVGVLCWLVVKELPEQRSQNQLSHIAFIQALDKHGAIIQEQSHLLSDLTREIREMRTARLRITPDKENNN